MVSQESASKQGVDTLDPPAAGSVPHMQSTALQGKTLIGSENQDLTYSEVDTIKNIMVIE